MHIAVISLHMAGR